MKKLKAKRNTRAGAASQSGLSPSVGARKIFSADEIRKCVDPGPPEEAEKFAELLYEERRLDRESAVLE